MAKKKMETIGNTEEGNTKTSSVRCVPGKYWCFTFNNYTPIDLETMEIVFNKHKVLYYFGEEVGESGTPHLQGFIQCVSKCRPVEKFKLSDTIHWEKCRGSKEQNVTYCGKDARIHTNMKFKKPVVDPMEGLEYKTWQLDILEIIKNEPDKRKVYWFWENTGRVGKSDFATHLCLKHDAVAVAGKGADVKFAIATLLEKRDIPIVIWDIPRCVDKDYISYTAIEEVKCGRIFSTKFESGMVIFNRPHLIIFANEEPDKSKLSEDRWVIVNIKS